MYLFISLFFPFSNMSLERSTGKYGINSNFTAAEGFKHSGYTKFSDIYLCGFGVQISHIKQ